MAGMIRQLCIGLSGVALGVGATIVLTRRADDEIGRTYSVYKIIKQEQTEGNVDALVQVFLSGERGHTKEIRCLFPPTTRVVEVELPAPTETPEEAEKRRAFGEGTPFEGFVPEEDFFPQTELRGISRLRIIRSRADKYDCDDAS